MTTDDVPARVRRLLEAHVETYEQLEALLFLARRGKPHNADTVAEELGIAPEAALEALQHLRARGLVVETSAGRERVYRIETASTHADSPVQTLARLYEERRMDVAKLMTDNAIARMRTATIRRFADAFIVKRSPKNDG
jgi:predicted ArsR family transcriptional regulator